MLPFAGLKVIDVSRVLAGPYCCALLGDLGTQVIKIEDPERSSDPERATRTAIGDIPGMATVAI